MVLVAEDNPVLREHVESLTRQAGFEVHSVQDGLQALQALATVRPDLVVTDLHMPRLDGRQLILRLRQLPQLEEIPIMMVTGDESRETKIALLESGADDFIVKPLDPDEYTARLRALAKRCDLLSAIQEVTVERDALYRALEERNRELERLTLGLVAALERANSLNDADTGNHIRRVSSYAGMLAQAYGCEPLFVAQVIRYASLHDVGKVGIRDAILKKPGRLTAEEFEEMKTHTLIGAELLRSAGLPEVASNIALCHHERWDGTGYPHGLAGQSIPLEARIVSVVDVFDALQSRRCYKPAFTYEKSKRILNESAGHHLDPDLVELLFLHEEEIHRIAARYADDVPDAGAWE